MPCFYSEVNRTLYYFLKKIKSENSIVDFDNDFTMNIIFL